MKKFDVLLIISILAIAVLWFGIMQFTSQDGQNQVRVTVDGEEYGRYDLQENQVVMINDTNELVIQDGKASMEEANCPDKLCVHQKAISKDGESIICLPNKVVAAIVGGEENEIDAVSN